MILSLFFSSLSTISFGGHSFLLWFSGTRAISLGMSSTFCLSGQVAIGSGDIVVDMT